MQALKRLAEIGTHEKATQEVQQREVFRIRRRV